MTEQFQLPLLQTKLYIPATRPDIVVRARLVTRLNAGIQPPVKVILISAPAGFGKTTLISSWLQQLDTQCNEPIYVAWLSLDDGDNVPLQCLHYIISALQTIKPEIGKSALAAAQSSSAAPIEMLATYLLNELTALSQQIVLVLDDYHTITALDVHKMLNFLIEHLPPNLHLLISTREDPPLALSRLRVRQQLIELRAADLRFTEAEAAAFLNELMALDLTPDDVAALESRTEGWIAGLQLAALSLRTTADKSDFVQAFAGSHRFLTDYLVDEVLSRQTPAVQKFLRRTAILERFCVDVCDAILEDGDSRQTLRQLEQANLFLIPLDNARNWFRYHHLFADFLRVRLYENEPDRVPELYHRAIDWFEHNDLPREALQYALKAQDYERAADLIETLAPEILEHDNHMLVVQWADALPPALVKQRAYLCVYLGWAWVIAAKMDTARKWLQAAESLCAQLTPDHKRSIQGHIAAHRAYIAFLQGTYTPAIEYAQQALTHLPHTEMALRARTLTCLGNGYNYAGRLEEAKQTFARAIDIAKHTGSLSLAMFSYGSLGEVFRDEGRWANALEVYEQLLHFAESLSGNPDGPLTGYAQFEIGVIWREWYDFDKAIAQLKKGVDLCREWRQGEALSIGLMELAETHRLRGEYAEAAAALDEVREVAADISPWANQLVAGFVARLALSQDDIEAAKLWVTHSGLEEAACAIGYERFPECLPLLRFYIATKDLTPALMLAEHLIERDRTLGRMGRVLDVLVLYVVALDAAGHKTQAAKALTEALSIATPHNHIRPFVEHGAVLTPYLRKFPTAPLRDRLLAIFGDTLSAPAAKPDMDEQVLTDTLNKREIQVLRLMAAGLSNREIASELFLSVNTVRWYASQLYSKLNVKRRGEAVAKAQELGIL